MGTRIQSLANNFTTTGIVKAAAINDTSVSGITSIPAGLGGALTLIKSITASASASIEFINGTDGVVLDGTYSSYVFKFINIHPATNDVAFRFQGSTNGGSSYGVTITSTAFRARHSENDIETGLDYQTSWDLAQSTSFQLIGQSGNDSDQNIVSTLQIFNPSSTTYVKHWIITTNYTDHGDGSYNAFLAGYFNDGANAINAIKFQMSSGNIDDGIIKLYGVS